MYFCAPTNKKCRVWSEKIGMKARKKQNQNIYSVLLRVTFVIFRSNRIPSMLKTHSTKATAVGGSNNAGFGGRPPVARGQRGFEGWAPDSVAIYSFFFFFQKYAILGIFWSKFLFKTALLIGWIKYVDALPRIASRDACSHLPSLLLLYTTKLVG